MSKLDESIDKLKDSLNELDKRFLGLKKDVEWQQRTMLIVGALLLAFLGYTSLFLVPREVKKELAGDVVGEATKQAKEAAANAQQSYKTVESIVQSLKSVTIQSNNSDSGCVKHGDLVICWGKRRFATQGNGFAFEFSFDFPHQFQQPPTITTGMLGNDSGFLTFAITKSKVTESNFVAEATECNARQHSGPILVNYIAIGK